MFLVLSLIFVVVHLVYLYRYYKELSQITNQPLFLYAFWCNASFILSPVGFVLWLVAWLGIKELKQHSALSPKEQKEKQNKNFKQKSDIFFYLTLLNVITFGYAYIFWIFAYRKAMMALSEIANNQKLAKISKTSFWFLCLLSVICFVFMSILSAILSLGDLNNVFDRNLIMMLYVLIFSFVLVGIPLLALCYFLKNSAK